MIDPSDCSESKKPDAPETAERVSDCAARPVEIGGRTGPEPTRYGDWEKGGRCIDF